jgi:hypothetical protein
VSLRVLVEGESDRVAVETIARRLGHELAAAAVAVVPIGGAHAIGRFLDASVIGGLCDAGEENVVRRALERAGRVPEPGRTGLEAVGFFICETDLEDELIRALGTDRVEEVLAETGELRPFRTMQRQPAQRGRAVDAQLHRFIASHSGHKKTYARLLVEALDLDAVPRPLGRLVAHAATAAGSVAP